MTGHAEMKAEWGLINQRLNHSGWYKSKAKILLCHSSICYRYLEINYSKIISESDLTIQLYNIKDIYA